jgi:hypothetical protein
MTLIHLVSGQTLQNLLPIMAFRPDRVIQIKSFEQQFPEKPLPPFWKKAKALQDAASVDGISAVDVVVHELSSSWPSIEEVYEVALELFKKIEGPVLVNVTGGTKLMSIGLRQAATEGNYPCVYCDTEGQGDFLSVGTGTLPQFTSFDETIQKLSVRQVMIANGVTPDKLSISRPSQELCEFGKKASQLWGEAPASMESILTGLRQAMCPNGNPVSKSGLGEALSKGFAVEKVAEEWANAAVKVDLLKTHERELLLSPGREFDCMNRKEALALARKNFRQLEGGWWETEVYRECLESKRFLDLGMEVQSAPEDSIGESDVIGVSIKQRSLVFISCKVSDDHVKPLEHVFEFTQRARQFGGLAARAVFVFREVSNEGKLKKMKEACQTLRSRLVVGTAELEKWVKDA